MAKIFIKPSADKTPLLGYVRLEKKSTLRDKVSGSEVTETEFVEKKYSRAPGTSVRICANPSIKLHGNLNSGMLHEIANPYKDHKVWADKQFQAVLEGNDKAKVQHILEFKYNKPFNYLTNQFVDPFVTDAKDLTALMRGEYTMELNDGVTVLDTDTEHGEIMSYIIKANELIANSFEELTGNHDFYIAKEQEEEKVRLLKEAVTDRAIAALVRIYDGTNREVLIEFCKALDIRKVRLTADSAYNELKAFAKRSKENAKFLLETVELESEEATRNVFKARVMLFDARDCGAILKEGASYVWYPPNNDEGIAQKSISFDRYSGDNSIIEFLSHPKFANEQKEILTQIERSNKYRK